MVSFSRFLVGFSPIIRDASHIWIAGSTPRRADEDRSVSKTIVKATEWRRRIAIGSARPGFRRRSTERLWPPKSCFSKERLRAKPIPRIRRSGNRQQYDGGRPACAYSAWRQSARSRRCGRDETGRVTQRRRVATILGEVARPACAPRNHGPRRPDVAAGADNFQRHPAADLARNQPPSRSDFRIVRSMFSMPPPMAGPE